MTAARALRNSPRRIAETLAADMDLAAGAILTPWRSRGPGFLNFRLGGSWYADVLRNICAEGAQYGCIDALRGLKIMVEFVSANPTGPMHMGNARGGVLGDALAEVLHRAGADGLA
jgi:arginyl-tRNA synthetase